MENGLNALQQNALIQIQSTYQNLGDQSIVHLLVGDKTIQEWEHYPKGDVKDCRHHTQYFYHCHAGNDGDRVAEHGHLHIFFRKPIMPAAIKPEVVSQKYADSNGEKDNLTHIVSIAMNEFGFPSAFFTVNHWVVLGAWYDAETIASLLDQFVVDSQNPKYAVVDNWLTHMICLFKDNIIELLYQRDQVIAQHAKQDGRENVYYDKSLEITSILPLA